MVALSPVVWGERWLDEVLISGQLANLDGDRTDTLSVPEGIGTIALMEIVVFADQVATMVANPELLGVFCDVVDAGSGVRDIIGVERWSRINATMLATYFSPDPLVEVKGGESVRFIFQEVDTNAAPTADFTVRIKGTRVRPGVVARGPVRLVR